MSRALGTVALLLVLALALPSLARAVQPAVPALLSLLIILAILRLVLPPPPRR